ncbi:hypothetical protein OIU14_12880 [Thalassobacter stenotrophicus]|uniref:hypothetical protein n=1 Tax=Thalassobacter stenotrophicus TaxID=266809 RepID=UPI0022A9AE92|nr:hypothetical protein [Thalassobacter stenotrophicus]UYP67366.1 hypothetical protein OIU14_12880 [Thalassobacter stenotrophicus]
MKLSHLFLSTALCAVAAMPALAQQRTFSSVDTNNDGELSQSELEEAFGVSGAKTFLSRNDRDGNNSVSVAEIQIAQSDESDDEVDDDESDDDESDNDESDNDESDDDESDDDESDDSGSDESDSDEGDSDDGGSDESDD